MKDQVGGNQKRARFQALCQSLRPDLLRFAFWLSRDRALAEDVVQETMLRAWKAQDSLLDEAAAFRPRIEHRLDGSAVAEVDLEGPLASLFVSRRKRDGRLRDRSPTG